MMKKEFGKWFLDLAKYILTAITFTTLFTGMEETKLLVTTFAAFSVCVLFGYLLLRKSDMEGDQVKLPVKARMKIEPVEDQVTDIKNAESNRKNNKKKNKK